VNLAVTDLVKPGFHFMSLLFLTFVPACGLFSFQLKPVAIESNGGMPDELERDSEGRRS